MKFKLILTKNIERQVQVKDILDLKLNHSLFDSDYIEIKEDSYRFSHRQIAVFRRQPDSLEGCCPYCDNIGGDHCTCESLKENA